MILLLRRLERKRNIETHQIKRNKKTLKAIVTILTENESQITTNLSSCRKKKAERQIQEEGQLGRDKGPERRKQHRPNALLQLSEGDRLGGKERHRRGLIREMAIE